MRPAIQHCRLCAQRSDRQQQTESQSSAQALGLLTAKAVHVQGLACLPTALLPDRAGEALRWMPNMRAMRGVERCRLSWLVLRAACCSAHGQLVSASAESMCRAGLQLVSLDQSCSWLCTLRPAVSYVRGACKNGLPLFKSCRVH